jgi:hypothetical protein
MGYMYPGTRVPRYAYMYELRPLGTVPDSGLVRVLEVLVPGYFSTCISDGKKGICIPLPIY